MAGVRTPTRQFSSCVLVEAGDSLDAINGASNAIVKYISQRAGIGINIGAISGLGAPIRNGEAYHTGVIPFIKHFQTAVKSCSQGGLRGGSATAFYPMWTWEVESLLVLKNNRGTEDNRVRHLDYGVQVCKLMFNRLIKKGNITLFSMEEVPDLLAAFYADQDEFERLYVQYENNPNVRKKSVTAADLFGTLASERASTGRIYIQNVDHNNTHGAFIPDLAPIKQSNLCLEIALPTSPLNAENPSEGEIALCTLMAFNLGAIESLDEYQDLANIATRALDNLLDYQDYPHPAALLALKRRSLGIGVTNMAYYLAKNGRKYSDNSGLDLMHKTMEALQHSLLTASCGLAKERGSCDLFNETRYSQGELPIDHYKVNVDDLCKTPLQRDWEALREQIKRYGLRHSTLTALMPCETSSQISNSTNGIEPPRGFISVKASKDGTFKQVVPDYKSLKSQYELLWDLPSNTGYLNLVAVMGKFVDQAISANTSYDPEKFTEGKVPMSQVLQDLIYAWKYGVKNLYYHNTRDGSGEEEDCDGCKV
jgi:ribonucleoside-diphosphate reductase alpha chain